MIIFRFILFNLCLIFVFTAPANLIKKQSTEKRSALTNKIKLRYGTNNSPSLKEIVSLNFAKKIVENTYKFCNIFQKGKNIIFIINVTIYSLICFNFHWKFISVREGFKKIMEISIQGAYSESHFPYPIFFCSKWSKNHF